MTDQPDTLLEAVHSLTDRYSIHATRDDGSKVRLRQKPRLEALREAIHPSGNSAGGGALARERNLINTGALDLYRAIVRDIDNAARIVDATIDPANPCITLKRWLIHARHKVTTDSYEAEWASKWDKRRIDIDNMLNPPVVIELMRPCPICGETKAIDRNAPGGPAIVTALIVQYRKSDEDTEPDPETPAAAIPENSTAMCRFCDTVWRGRVAVREVAFDIEAADNEGAA